MKINKAYLKAASTQEHLENMDRLCRGAPPGDFMECGVLRGGTAAILINAAEGKRKIWLCDTFRGYPIPGEQDTNIDKRPFKPGFGCHPIPEVQARLLSFGLNLDNVEFVKGNFGDTLPEVMKRTKGLALVNFDGDWYESVMQAFPHILSKLVKGGILIIHDYPKFDGMRNSVHKFIEPGKLKKFKRAPGAVGKYSGVYYVKE